MERGDASLHLLRILPIFGDFAYQVGLPRGKNESSQSFAISENLGLLLASGDAGDCGVKSDEEMPDMVGDPRNRRFRPDISLTIRVLPGT